jgi:hypothetical protein
MADFMADKWITSCVVQGCQQRFGFSRWQFDADQSKRKRTDIDQGAVGQFHARFAPRHFGNDISKKFNKFGIGLATQPPCQCYRFSKNLVALSIGDLE